MSKVEDFLTLEEEHEIISAIQEAEKNTSGEIRIHIERSCPVDDLFKRAMEIFHYLKMDNTKQQNGVLIYVAVDDHKFVIYGDQGINNVVEDDFWDSTKNVMQHHFKNGDFKQGLIEGVLKAGKKLETFFPWDQSNTNELPDDISKGELK
ncbi:TPM domain-containing protein [Mangrovimonas sp. YM274]|uniref:TPM domain-containing protein n=1 Tax=Mangrovimonas sp. YM274 TaxID=3070660 RepID=UPI0027DBFF6F|nr:TPM domain-containing protein [Mangrovimonas sp. YM274]WMI69702.1 TPM domain-containing protein [Mangrovimonas sp. YM274]